MTTTMTERDARLGRWLRLLAWGGAVAAWLVPVVVKATAGLPWTTFDFIVWGAMLLVAAGVCEVGLRLSGSLAYRAGVVVAGGTSFLIVWSNLAVGIIGDETNPLNQIFFGVIAIAAVGAFLARFRAKGMTTAMLAAAAAQAATIALAVVREPLVVAILGVFTLGWLLAAWLFREAARGEH